MSEQLELENHCYVLPQLRKGPIHPIAHRRHKLIWYPERAMMLFDQIMYRPYIQSVVTESPWIIACYPRDRVRVWSNEEWTNGGEWHCPDIQTYGADISGIMCSILGVQQTIPSTPLDGGKQIQKLIDKLTKERTKYENYT